MVPRGRAPVLLAELTLLHWPHDGPVAANRAVLDSPPTKPQRFHRNSRNPDRLEEVAAPAADDDRAAYTPAARPEGAVSRRAAPW